MNTVAVIVAVIILIGIGAFIGFFIAIVMVEIDTSYRKKKFKEDLLAVLKNNDIDNEIISFIYTKHGLLQKDIIRLIESIIIDIAKDQEKEIANNKIFLKEYLKEYRKNEPFDNIPDDIKIYLDKLNNDDNHSNLVSLTTKIKELIKINSSENKKQKFYTFAGFLFGVLGFSFGLYTYIVDPCLSESTFNQTMEKSQESITKEKNTAN